MMGAAWEEEGTFWESSRDLVRVSLALEQPWHTREGGALIGFRLYAMGELFIWQLLTGLSLGSEPGRGGGGGGCSLKEPQHLFHAVGEME